MFSCRSLFRSIIPINTSTTAESPATSSSSRQQMMNIHIKPIQPDQEILKLSIPPGATGQYLMNQVWAAFGIREPIFFGLRYHDNKGFIAWLEPKFRILEQDVIVKGEKLDPVKPLKFDLRVRFYPESFKEEIIFDSTLTLIYNHVRSLIHSGDIYCPGETAVNLAACDLQIRYGDHDSLEFQNSKPPVEEIAQLLPTIVREKHQLTPEEWSHQICEFHRTTKAGLYPEMAMRAYLSDATQLDQFGMSELFEVMNKRGSPLFLGIDAFGMNIFEPTDKLLPKVGIVWYEIDSVEYCQKTFTIIVNQKNFLKHMPKTVQDHKGRCEKMVFLVNDRRVARRIFKTAEGNHKLYQRRRRPDSDETKELKVQAKAETDVRDRERLSLQAQTIARQQAEYEKERMAEAFVEMQDEMRERTAEVAQAQKQIARLEAELKEMDQLKRRLAQAECELRDLHIQVEESEESVECEKLNAEVAAKKAQLRQMEAEMKEKSAITLQLKRQVNASHDAQKVMLRSVVGSYYPGPGTSVGDILSPSVDLVPPAFKPQPTYTKLVKRPSQPGRGQVARNAALFEQKTAMAQQSLNNLRAHLELNIRPHKITREDRLHQENRKRGRNKYSTLKEIRAGNTLRRVELFEHM